MLLQTLEIENFRNLATQTLEFSDGVNLLCGKNAAGNKFATLILVTFKRFNPIAKIKIEPTADISVIIASVKNAETNCAAKDSAPSYTSKTTPEKKHPKPREDVKIKIVTPSSRALV